MTDRGVTLTYTETTGYLFELGLPAIGRGCNTAGSMAGGIARDVKRRRPECYREYAERCRDGRFALVAFHAWEGPRPSVNQPRPRMPLGATVGSG